MSLSDLEAQAAYKYREIMEKRSHLNYQSLLDDIQSTDVEGLTQIMISLSDLIGYVRSEPPFDEELYKRIDTINRTLSGIKVSTIQYTKPLVELQAETVNDSRLRDIRSKKATGKKATGKKATGAKVPVKVPIKAAAAKVPDPAPKKAQVRKRVQAAARKPPQDAVAPQVPVPDIVTYTIQTGPQNGMKLVDVGVEDLSEFDPIIADAVMIALFLKKKFGKPKAVVLQSKAALIKVADRGEDTQYEPLSKYLKSVVLSLQGENETNLKKAIKKVNWRF